MRTFPVLHVVRRVAIVFTNPYVCKHRIVCVPNYSAPPPQSFIELMLTHDPMSSSAPPCGSSHFAHPTPLTPLRLRAIYTPSRFGRSCHLRTAYEVVKDGVIQFIRVPVSVRYVWTLLRNDLPVQLLVVRGNYL
jgi:hypothetical protein